MSDYQRQVQFVLPSPSKLFTPAVTTILILMIIGHAMFHYASDFTVNFLCLSRAGIFGGQVWQLVTYPFFTGCVWTLIFNLSIVLFIGSNVERQWRTSSFILLWLIVSILCGILWILVNLVFNKNYLGTGAAACSYGLIATFGLLLRKNKFMAFFWAVEAQVIAWLLIAIGFIVGIKQPIAWTWLSGALVAYLYIKISWKMRSGQSFRVKAESRSTGFVDLD